MTNSYAYMAVDQYLKMFKTLMYNLHEKTNYNMDYVVYQESIF
jgi:hypothetical protein